MSRQIVALLGLCLMLGCESPAAENLPATPTPAPQLTPDDHAAPVGIDPNRPRPAPPGPLEISRTQRRHP
jgi:hypothetical protein